MIFPVLSTWHISDYILYDVHFSPIFFGIFNVIEPLKWEIITRFILVEKFLINKIFLWANVNKHIAYVIFKNYLYLYHSL